MIKISWEMVCGAILPEKGGEKPSVIKAIVGHNNSEYLYLTSNLLFLRKLAEKVIRLAFQRSTGLSGFFLVWFQAETELVEAGWILCELETFKSLNGF